MLSCIGRAMGLSNDILHIGSYAAAKFPIKGTALKNEFDDWKAIDKGVTAYGKNNYADSIDSNCHWFNHFSFCCFDLVF